MTSKTNQNTFETHGEEIFLTKGGSKSGEVAEWDKERLCEYRPALIPAAVTGSIDMRMVTS